jgi:hypothetical protein
VAVVTTSLEALDFIGVYSGPFALERNYEWFKGNAAFQAAAAPESENGAE